MTDRMLTLTLTDDVCSRCKNIVTCRDGWGGLMMYCKLTFRRVFSDSPGCQYKSDGGHRQ